MHRFYKTCYDRIAGKLPPQVAAFLDLYLRLDLRDEWGGPFNGQMRRQEMMRELIGIDSLQAIVETGTYRGSTTQFFAREAKVPIYTVEANRRYRDYARFRLRDFKNIQISLGDSRIFLRGLFQKPGFPRKRVLFYLDAHWQKDLPLREEVSIIGELWGESVVVIDDFQVPDDPGYGFDDYGEGKRLCLEYLQLLPDSRWDLFWPSVPASAETSLRRGCVVLGTKDTMAEKLKRLKSLRSPNSGQRF